MVPSKAEKVLRKIEDEARMGRLPHPIVGNRGKILVEVIRENKPRRVLEIGTLVGYSAILMGKELSSDAHLITVEKDDNSAKIARENIRKAEIPPTVELIVGDALEIIPKLEGTFDLVFIDAEKSEYLKYLQLVENKLHKGSVVVADNAENAPDYLDYVRCSGKYTSKHIPAGAGGVEVSVKL
ncbi:O-methyltransferase [Candidatus Bathyarchaeota archaeon]|nr:O-methyltransferase [Candidatus Bathyarchaeota archaeon]